MSSHNTPATCDDYNLEEVEQQEFNYAELEVTVLLETVTQFEASEPDGSQRYTTSTQEMSCTFDLDEFFERPDIAYAHLLDQLTVLQIDQRIYDHIWRYVISHGQEYISRHGHVSYLAILVKVTDTRYVPADNQQRDLESIAMRESMVELERRNDGRVAASEEAVKRLLKSVIVESGNHMTCPICLEELKIGSYATSMPCSHMFHGKCIGCWLKESHYCPLCRFEMPTH